ncbi:hypothetical protein MASR1M90_07480 [Desulfovibrionales bacterium]
MSAYSGRTSHGVKTPCTRTPGFWPYISVVLINAMLDLGHKIVIQNTVFKYYSGTTQICLTALVNACILLPFIVFFTPAGFLADRFSKHLVIRYTAAFALPITVLIYLSYLSGQFVLSFSLTLILAAQSAFYSPAKYGYIKELAGENNLGQANGIVQAVTIIAILLGGVVFSGIFEALIGPAQSKEEIIRAIAPCGLFLMAGAALQTVLALRIPCIRPGDATARLDLHTYVRGGYTARTLRTMRENPIIWRSVLGLTMFWAVNQVLFAAFGAHVKDMAGVTSTVVAQGLLALGGVGIIIGSLTAGRLSRLTIEVGLVPCSALGMTVCLALIPHVAHVPSLALLLSVYGFFGGAFVVPLNALIQLHAAEKDLGSILAGNNFVQNIGMLFFLLLTVGASLTGYNSTPIISALALIIALGTVAIIRTQAPDLMRFLLRLLFALGYRLTVHGRDRVPATGGVLILANHISLLDWAALYLAAPRPVRFVMSRAYYKKWYLRWFLDLYRVIPISSAASPQALRSITEALRQGECVALFPEGGLSPDGCLGEFRGGFVLPALHAGSPLVPAYLHGLWETRWSVAPPVRHSASSWFRPRPVHIVFGSPVPSSTSPHDIKNRVQALQNDLERGSYTLK